MAGIGFQLHKLLEDESLFNKAKAYIFASIITSGPWILSILCLALLGALSGIFLKSTRFSVLSITIVYIFAFSLILTAPIQFILTRYLADMEYIKNKEKMLPALFTAFFFNVMIALIAASFWFIVETNLSPLYKIIATILFLIICSIWTMMDFLSCSKNYLGIILSFFGGSVISLFASVLFGYNYAIEGALAGYALGQLLILLLLIYFIKKEFKLAYFFNFEIIKYIKKYPFIPFTGLFYNLGLWIDKLLCWYIYGENIAGHFKAYSIYDTPIFIAYLIIIPSLAYFMIQAETSFFTAYRNFFDSINEEPLDKILKYKDELMIVLKKILVRLFFIQFIFSLAGFLGAEFIAAFMGLADQSIIILRLLFFAAGAQICFLYLIIFLMYFDLTKISFYLVSIFFVLNAGINLLLMGYNVKPLGLGYLLAIVLTVIISFITLRKSISGIEYEIFMNQGD